MRGKVDSLGNSNEEEMTFSREVKGESYEEVLELDHEKWRGF